MYVEKGLCARNPQSNGLPLARRLRLRACSIWWLRFELEYQCDARDISRGDWSLAMINEEGAARSL